MSTTTAPVPAVTTIFTPPASCLDSTYTLRPQGIDYTSDRDTQTLIKAYSTECYPSQATLSDGYVFASPGLCPSAWTIASGLRVSDDFYHCGSWPSLSSVILLSERTAIATEVFPRQTPYMIAWQNSDLSILQHHPTATGTFDIPTGSTIPAATTITPTPFADADSGTLSSPNLATSTNALDAQRVELSTGAKAGIGVGVAAGVMILVLVAFLFWRRRRKQRAAAAQHAPIPQEDLTPEVHGEHRHMYQLGEEGIIHQAGAGKKSTEIYQAGDGKKSVRHDYYSTGRCDSLRHIQPAGMLRSDIEPY
ncbi:hypothetical protein CLAFUW4_11314 [Fulvia fulva]|nr:hypothetical protein CLAFUR4_11320 [Fulvia fulva]WPV16942.1 hypothetical protein CLAFUW4_11314 [Fulvia fulva]WPV32696.1 hypothetical protein CLAFUW7_11310 [Fulvia fulva]